MKKTILFASLMTLSLPTMASQLGFSPVYIYLTPNQSQERITLSNRGDEDVRLQAQVERVTQSGGHIQSEATSDVKASPGAVLIPPHSQAVIRIVRLIDFPATEQDYVVKISELPTDTTVEQGSSSKTTVTVKQLLSFALPIFMRREEWKPEVSGTCNGQSLSVTNKGTATAQIANVSWTGGQAQGLVGYVQPGQTMSFPMACKGAVQALVNMQPQAL